jgi:hypothetical protein
MATGQVQVTFSGPVSFLTSELWINLRASLQARLPLRNLHWKSPTRPSIRTIQELDLELVPLESRLETHSSPVPTSVLERPLLNLYFISCEVGFVRLVIYKSKRLIRTNRIMILIRTLLASKSKIGFH